MSISFWIHVGLAVLQIGGLLYIWWINHKQFKLEEEHLGKQMQRLNKEAERLKGNQDDKV